MDPSTSPLTDVDTAAVARLRLAVVRLSRQIRQRARSGVTPSQLSALTSIDRHGPMRLADLADHEGIARSTVTRMVRALEDAALLARSPDPDDGRSSIVSLTARGEALLAEARQRAQAFLVERVRDLGLPAGTVDEVTAVLERLGGRP